MEFLVMNGSIVLECSHFEELSPLQIGDEDRAANGELRGVYIAEKRRFRGSFHPTSASLASIRTVIALGNHVTLGGSAIGTTITVRGTIERIPYVMQGTGFIRDIDVDFEQV